MFNKLFANCILVEDFDKSLRFYKGALGLEVNNQDGKFADFKLEGTSLAIFEKKSAIAMFPGKFMGKGGGIVLAFQVKNLGKACEGLNQKGVKIFEGPKVTAWGQKVAYFKDPDDNIWEISEPFDEK